MANNSRIPWKIKLIPVIGIVLISTAICSYLITGKMIKYNVEKNIVIKPNSTAFKFWEKPPADILRKYYVFDVINPSEIQKGAKPVLIQRGPYVYREIWEKKNVEFIGDEFLTFIPVVTLHFEPSLSIGPESDEVTFLNIPAVGMIESATRFKIPGSETIIDLLLKTMRIDLFVTHTVGELIGGYEDPLMKMAKVFMPSLIKDDKFSLVHGENGTTWQNYTIMTGINDVMSVGRIITWDGKEKLDFWNTHHANLINGTDGSFYPPYRTRDQKVYSFNADMCRSYHLVYLQDNKFKDLDVYDYHLPSNIFSNSTYNSENEGFCEGPCLGNGVLNISACYGGVSGFVSQPHFLNADDKFIQSIDGLTPNKDTHDFVIHFEPMTGVPLGGNIRLQISFFLPKSSKIDLVKGVEPVLFPLFWFDDSLALYDDTLKQFRQISTIVEVSNVVIIAMLSLGTLLAFAGTAVIIFKRYRNNLAAELSINNAEIPNETSSLLGENTANGVAASQS